MSETDYIADLLSRRYSTVALNADHQLVAAMRAADRAEILTRASREMTLIRNCEHVIKQCNLGAYHG